jgi:hypothetical protein
MRAMSGYMISMKKSSFPLCFLCIWVLIEAIFVPSVISLPPPEVYWLACLGWFAFRSCFHRRSGLSSCSHAEPRCCCLVCVLFDLLPPVFSSVQASDLAVFVRLAASYVLLHSTAGVAHLFCVLLRSRRGWALSVDRLDPHLGPHGVVFSDKFFFCRPVSFHVLCCRLFSLIWSGAAIVRFSISHLFFVPRCQRDFPGVASGHSWFFTTKDSPFCVFPAHLSQLRVPRSSLRCCGLRLALRCWVL